MSEPSASNTKSLETSPGLMPALSTGGLPAVVTVVLPPEKAGEVGDLAERYRLATVEPHHLITFGQEAIGGFGAKLDAILSQITNAQSPVLFELFRTIRDGINDADLKGLEASIREKLKGNFLERLLTAVGLGDPAKRLKSVTDEVRGMLQSKAKSLGDLVRPMEAEIEEESGKLILEVSRMSTLAEGYRDTIVSLGVFVEAGRRILADAGRELDRLTEEAASGDPLKVQEARDFSQKRDIFQNRVLVLETAYAKAPADLDSIGIARGAALATLADTVTSANAEFNDIKSMLIRLHALFQMQSIQQMNTMRRELRASLQHYGSEVLEDVSVNSVRAAGETRLADADLVLGTAQRLRNIADKVVAEGERNKERYAAARAKLEQARQIVTDRPI
ncbi:Toxic anion resistance protein (TelA) [Rhizobium sp. NZLR1b]|uniref:Toxic anion resistance protein (TelA) n=1 Tax=unclassified Rhizobium TaxID=2613769 RepID=UPI001C836F91|nr:MULTISPECIES: Toxic anion resistance protein (TelA) [unclassified Rhizobium]MBX5172008.1 Toxic anion resistance protein (TelA) [Rhizobium sp. NZLR1b]MBX5191582.1 Toxic anion resistance protein (TelA) [Rhizobium sp. NZLR3b]MBX5197393.1 Toxic anion resistance protein (TelA) [Rhizobium sp. NZLR10]